MLRIAASQDRADPVRDLTAVVLTWNEEDYIADCLASLKWCDRIIVLDSLSTDRTVEIARRHGAEVRSRPFSDFADQRNAALELIESAWVLFVDADERVSPQLAAEILQAIRNAELNGYWIPTHNYLLGRLLLHAGLYPDYHLRLFRKGKGHYDPAQKVHEYVRLDGATDYLRNPLIHISCHTWSEFIDHQKHWARLKAEVHFERGVKPSYHFIVGPTLEFLRRYVLLQGYRDGLRGLYLSYLFAYYYFVMYVHLGRLWITHPEPGTP
jgi:glycosyltransferase involved in cell wall biosynthesis